MEKRMELISEEMLMMRIEQMAQQIEKEHEGKELTLICILKGAAHFFADLTKRIHLDVEEEFIRVASYEGEKTTGELEFKLKLDENVITDKDVIVVEDIIDTGKTLLEILKYLEEQKPHSVKLCTLLDKPERRVEHNVKVDYVGFKIPNLFVIGYGLDLDQKYRNMPSIHCIVHSEKEEAAVEKNREELKKQVDI